MKNLVNYIVQKNHILSAVNITFRTSQSLNLVTWLSSVSPSKSFTFIVCKPVSGVQHLQKLSY